MLSSWLTLLLQRLIGLEKNHHSLVASSVDHATVFQLSGSFLHHYSIPMRIAIALI
jgi:hypothetical protein